jgi:hypothetical protein
LTKEILALNNNAFINSNNSQGNELRSRLAALEQQRQSLLSTNNHSSDDNNAMQPKASGDQLYVNKEGRLIKMVNGSPVDMGYAK